MKQSKHFYIVLALTILTGTMSMVCASLGLFRDMAINLMLFTVGTHFLKMTYSSDRNKDLDIYAILSHRIDTATDRIDMAIDRMDAERVKDE